MSSSDIPQPHDGIVRLAFSELPQAISFFQEYLPAPVVEALDWDSLTLLDGTFVDEDLRQAETDRLYSIPFIEKDGETRILLYILFEHQSSEDDWMPVRLLFYMCCIWKRWRSQHSIKDGLPLILPFVLSHAPGGWRVTRQFHDLFRWPKSEALREILKQYIPLFEYELLDLKGTDLEALRGGPFVRVLLGVLKTASEGDPRKFLGWAVLLMVSPPFMAVNQTVREALYLYMFKVAELNPEEFRATVDEIPLTGEQTKAIMSLADYLKQEGLEEGLEKGRREGRQEGRQEGLLIGQVQMLQQLLGRPVESFDNLNLHSNEQLESMLAGLQREVRAQMK